MYRQSKLIVWLAVRQLYLQHGAPPPTAVPRPTCAPRISSFSCRGNSDDGAV